MRTIFIPNVHFASSLNFEISLTGGTQEELSVSVYYPPRIVSTELNAELQC